MSRHGRPALDRTAGPKLTWQEYRDWWERYEIGSLAEDQVAPDRLKAAVANVDLVLSSVRPRAIETAQWATEGRTPETNPVFNEAPLPPPRFKGRTFLPKTWNILARAYWLRGHKLDGESVNVARVRIVVLLRLGNAQDLQPTGQFAAGHPRLTAQQQPIGEHDP